MLTLQTNTFSSCRYIHKKRRLSSSVYQNPLRFLRIFHYVKYTNELLSQIVKMRNFLKMRNAHKSVRGFLIFHPVVRLLRFFLDKAVAEGVVDVGGARAVNYGGFCAVGVTVAGAASDNSLRIACGLAFKKYCR